MRTGPKRSVPFALGMIAAWLVLYRYGAVHPATEPPALEQVNAAFIEAMASATPAPAFSTQVYGAIQPALVPIQTSDADDCDTEGQGPGSGTRDTISYRTQGGAMGSCSSPSSGFSCREEREL